MGLVVHRERIGLFLEDAPPIEQLLPGVAENDRYRVIERETNRLIPSVSWVLDRLGIPTEVTLSDYRLNLEDPELATKKFDRTLDLIDNFFELPRDGPQQQQLFRFVIQALERGIGALNESRRAALRRAFSPISWLAWIVGFPIRILEHAGVPMEDASSQGVQMVAWVLRLGMSALLALLATKLGFSVPWEKITAIFR